MTLSDLWTLLHCLGQQLVHSAEVTLFSLLTCSPWRRKITLYVLEIIFCRFLSLNILIPRPKLHALGHFRDALTNQWMASAHQEWYRIVVAFYHRLEMRQLLGFWSEASERSFFSFFPPSFVLFFSLFLSGRPWLKIVNIAKSRSLWKCWKYLSHFLHGLVLWHILSLGNHQIVTTQKLTIE